MNSEIKAKWVAALRSGDYVQGTGALRKFDSFCCLGVLCDLHQKEMGDREWTGAPGMEKYLDASAHLPIEVRVWSGLEGNWDPTVRPKGHPANQLSKLNDGGFSFDAISDLIETQL